MRHFSKKLTTSEKNKFSGREHIILRYEIRYTSNTTKCKVGVIIKVQDCFSPLILLTILKPPIQRSSKTNQDEHRLPSPFSLLCFSFFFLLSLLLFLLFSILPIFLFFLLTIQFGLFPSFSFSLLYGGNICILF